MEVFLILHRIGQSKSGNDQSTPQAHTQLRSHTPKGAEHPAGTTARVSRFLARDTTHDELGTNRVTINTVACAQSSHDCLRCSRREQSAKSPLRKWNGLHGSFSVYPFHSCGTSITFSKRRTIRIPVTPGVHDRCADYGTTPHHHGTGNRKVGHSRTSVHGRTRLY